MTPRWPARGPLTFGYAAILTLIGGLGVWGVGTEIEGAVIASGTVRVESARQIVQHPDGGVVGEINARDGDRVRAGDTLIRLDGTFLRSELAIIEGQLLEVHVRRARLMAERDGRDAMHVPPPPDFAQLAPSVVSEQVAGQRSLFHARLSSLRQEQNALAEQGAQIVSQVSGYTAQLDALRDQSAIAKGELADLRKLLDKGLIEASPVLNLEREVARIQGETGRLTALIAEARSRQSALDIEGLRLLDTRREDAITALRDLELSRIELEERRLERTERLARLDLRAPVDGTIFGSRIFALGAVIRPADPVMYVVPGKQPLEIAARIAPTDVDQVYPGQEVSLTLTAFNMRTTPTVAGELVRVSADAVADDATGETYFEAVIVPDQAEMAALEDIALRPGMPVEAFLRTEARRPIDYLTQPLSVYFSRALREE